MGLTFHEYKFLEEVSKKKEFKNILCLGKQEMILTKEDKKKLKLLEKENAILGNRELMGATNPKDAEEGTIRKKVAISKQENSVHGSDSIENAEKEIAFFFDQDEIVG